LDSAHFGISLLIYDICIISKSEVVPQPKCPSGGADLQFVSPQSDTSWSCSTMNMGLVHCMVCKFTSHFLQLPNGFGTLT